MRVGDELKLVGKIDKREKNSKGDREKVHISASLFGEDGTNYCQLKGMSVTPVPMHTIDDAVARRTWLADEKVLRDSGWEL